MKIYIVVIRGVIRLFTDRGLADKEANKFGDGARIYEGMLQLQETRESDCPYFTSDGLRCSMKEIHGHGYPSQPEETRKSAPEKVCPDCMAHYPDGYDHVCPPWLKAAVEEHRCKQQNPPAPAPKWPNALLRAEAEYERGLKEAAPEAGEKVSEACSNCGSPFLPHHHRHYTKKGLFHTGCYKKTEAAPAPKEKETWEKQFDAEYGAGRNEHDVPDGQIHEIKSFIHDIEAKAYERGYEKGRLDRLAVDNWHLKDHKETERVARLAQLDSCIAAIESSSAVVTGLREANGELWVGVGFGNGEDKITLVHGDILEELASKRSQLTDNTKA